MSDTLSSPEMAALQQARADYQHNKQVVLAQVHTSGASSRTLHASLQAFSELTDALLIQLWGLAQMPPEWALLAVGGYGRTELFPSSDVDVLVLLPDQANPPDAQAQARIERFISACWDVGLDIGASVRTVAECVALAQEDLTAQTAMLESRRITGHTALIEAYTAAIDAATDPATFFVAKVLEMRQRHQKYEDTPYALEPNVKESPGGLRDLQVIRWVARAAGLGHSWQELAANGVATLRESTLLQRHERLLGLIRARLHLLTRRREDRLVFDLQTQLAETFGYQNSFNAEGRLALRASEMLMRRYYWSAKAVTQLNQILLQGIEERLRTAKGLPDPISNPINARFVERAGLIDLVRDDLYQRDPHAILDTFLTYEQASLTHGVRGLSARVLRALFNARTHMNSDFRNDPVNRATFLAILQAPKGITHAMRLMNQTSVLGRYLWVFRRIVGQMQHDLFHVYTVDQHILMVLRNVRRFFMAEHTHEYPFCSQLAAGWDKPWLLYTAALFHDIAKGRGGDHSELGAEEVRRFCQTHGVAQADTELLEFLVREHLTMSQTAQKQDLSDPDVIAAFAKRMGSERRLTALYLLTVADIRGTSPKVWNAWRGKLLEDLYRATARALGGNEPDASTLVQANKREALVLLARGSAPHQAEQTLWQTLDVSYFMRHDPSEIAWHTRQISRFLVHSKPEQPEVLVRARLSPVGEGLQVLLYAPDKVDLFARACGYFDKSSLSVVDARIYTTRNGYALDTFQVITEEHPEHYRELINLVESGLNKAVLTPELPAPRAGRPSRRVRYFPVTPRLELRPDDKALRWLLSLSASDRPGLLYAIAHVFARYGISVRLAKILTLGERAEDHFLLEGQALQDNKTQLALERDLLQVLANP